MYAERGGNSGGICVHIVHGFEHMPHQAKTRALQIMQNLGDLAPVFHFRFGFGIVMERADDDVGHLAPHADGHAGEFGH